MRANPRTALTSPVSEFANRCHMPGRNMADARVDLYSESAQ
eukprot:CAMPEP_0185905582 /NCGR_PEP_ID=MMETSP0196C-20130402/4784_1 /TAXON_ID=2932 /ORGANISM="Alexandrium fundyense, Strain CCMP1719" /LENGTH=40 /DNA_ID= /DNA_START= /DNA_END= /DNA_ORIENTATION=